MFSYPCSALGVVTLLVGCEVMISSPSFAFNISGSGRLPQAPHTIILRSSLEGSDVSYYYSSMDFSTAIFIPVTPSCIVCAVCTWLDCRWNGTDVKIPQTSCDRCELRTAARYLGVCTLRSINLYGNRAREACVEARERNKVFSR